LRDFEHNTLLLKFTCKLRKLDSHLLLNILNDRVYVNITSRAFQAGSAASPSEKEVQMSKKQTLEVRRNQVDRKINRLSKPNTVQELEDPALQALRRTEAKPELSSPTDVLALQRSLGNQAVQRLFGRKPKIVNKGMHLTEEGALAVQQGAPERAELLDDLLYGAESIEKFTNGDCYDAVAFTMYLRGLVTPKELTSNSGKAWRGLLFYQPECTQWTGEDIPAGSAVGFERIGEEDDRDREIFHAGLAKGGADMRAINGGALGNTWDDPVNIAQVLNNRVSPGIFKYKGQLVRVWYK
jgi:hypothetical protein